MPSVQEGGFIVEKAMFSGGGPSGERKERQGTLGQGHYGKCQHKRRARLVQNSRVAGKQKKFIALGSLPFLCERPFNQGRQDQLTFGATQLLDNRGRPAPMASLHLWTSNTEGPSRKRWGPSKGGVRMYGKSESLD